MRDDLVGIDPGRHGGDDNKKGTRHLGEYDPGTGKQVKPPDPTRTVEA